MPRSGNVWTIGDFEKRGFHNRRHDSKWIGLSREQPGKGRAKSTAEERGDRVTARGGCRSKGSFVLFV